MRDYERGYFYDWTCKPPCTTDPKYRGKLKGGKHQKVFLNGEDMGDVRKCVTGGKCVGWVEKNVRDESGNFVLQEDNNEIITRRFYGEVEYICDD